MTNCESRCESTCESSEIPSLSGNFRLAPLLPPGMPWGTPQGHPPLWFDVPSRTAVRPATVDTKGGPIPARPMVSVGGGDDRSAGTQFWDEARAVRSGLVLVRPIRLVMSR